MRLRLFTALFLVGFNSPLSAQQWRTGAIADRFQELCASCHGANLQGGQAQSLLDDVWVHAKDDDESLAQIIRQGIPEKGMPAWSAALPEKDIRAMVIFIREQRTKYSLDQTKFEAPTEDTVAQSQHYKFSLKTWVGDLREPWSLAFLPGNRALVTEKRGRFFLIENGKRSKEPISGLPEIDNTGQGGLFDVVLHPKFESNGWIYLAFAERRSSGSLTKVIRGKLRDGAFVDQETIFEGSPDQYIRAGGPHFGGRIAFDRAGYLYFTIGDRGRMPNAQELEVPQGKVHRLFDDGRIPPDNPFVKTSKALPTIWSYGHRNPQGLAIHPGTGDLYDAEHGPRGGDEINLILRGHNYGWPVITYGMNYNGTPITDLTHKEGMEQPVTYWVPSIGICGINFYAGDLFPKWKHNLFTASLSGEDVRRLEIQGNKITDQEILFKRLGRVRHVITGPDGALYVLLPTRIARMAPVE